MPKYKTIFFDLDHTLWDYENNSKETLQELFDTHQLQQRGVDNLDAFHEKFNLVNEELWYLYDRGLIESEVIREQRFKKILQPFGIADEYLTATLSYQYLHNCPRKGALLPFATDVLDYLKTTYSLTIITNGFEEIQTMKLASGGITKYFDHIVTSQKTGYKKPAKEIFDYALALHNSSANEALMIGDNLLTDVAGAKNGGIDTVLFNPYKKQHTENVTHEIESLKELILIL